MFEVPLFDLRRSQERIENEIISCWKDVLHSSRFITGDKLERFEHLFAEYCNRQYGIGTNSGTDALLLSLMAYNVGVGDEVLVPAFTFYATAAVVERVGAKTVFADVNEDTYMINPEDLSSKITKKTKAIIPVHLFGQPSDLESIMKIANLEDLAVIEDASQAAGAMYDGMKIGSFGMASCFSFYPTKNLAACGDAGIILTDNPEAESWLRKARNHGMKGKTHDYDMVGINSRMDELQAVVLEIKLKRLNEMNEQRTKLAKKYLSELSHLETIRLPKAYENSTPTWNKFCIRVLCDRQKFRQHLADSGIQTGIYYPKAINKTEYFINSNKKCPVAEQLQSQILAIPLFPGMTVPEQDQVISAIKSYRGE